MTVVAWIIAYIIGAFISFCLVFVADKMGGIFGLLIFGVCLIFLGPICLLIAAGAVIANMIGQLKIIFAK